jgi:hypothetical protein
VRFPAWQPANSLTEVRHLMPRTNLTQFKAERLRPPAVKAVTHFDKNLAGFGLRVSSRGRKTLIAQYRIKRGKEVVETLGVLPVLTVDEARNRARQSLNLARRGLHPVRERAATAQADRSAPKSERIAAALRFLRRLGLSAEDLIAER